MAEAKEKKVVVDTIDLKAGKESIKLQIKQRKAKLDFFIKNEKDIEAARAKLK